MRGRRPRSEFSPKRSEGRSIPEEGRPHPPPQRQVPRPVRSVASSKMSPPPPRRPRLPRELFETRSHAWHSLGLGDELAPRFSKRQFGGLLLALLLIAGTLFVYEQRREIA